MASQHNDLEYGLMNEETVLQKLQQHFNTVFSRRGGYATFDYVSIDGEIEVELKSRRITHDRYDSTIIGLNKVQYCNDPNKKYYFAFLYTDGLFIVRHDRSVFDGYERNDRFMRGVRDDCATTPQHIVLIPVEALERVVV